jgi:hypothetical protein
MLLRAIHKIVSRVRGIQGTTDRCGRSARVKKAHPLHIKGESTPQPLILRYLVLSISAAWPGLFLSSCRIEIVHALFVLSYSCLTTCHIHIIIPDIVTSLIFDERYKLRGSSLCNLSSLLLHSSHVRMK